MIKLTKNDVKINVCLFLGWLIVMSILFVWTKTTKYFLIGSNAIWGIFIIIFNAWGKELAKFAKEFIKKMTNSYSNKLLNSETKPYIDFKGYDYYDHSGGRYMEKMVNICIDENDHFYYNFDLTIEENIIKTPKLNEIGKFVKNHLGGDLAKILNDEPQLISNAKSVNNDNTFAVISLSRGRLDYEEKRETALLKIVLARTDIRTIYLIDSIYNLLKVRYEPIMTSVFKKILLKENGIRSASLNDLLLFATKFELNGYLIHSGNNEYHVINSSSPEQLSYSLVLPFEINKNVLSGIDLSNIIKENFKSLTIDKTSFTDVCISYNIGIHIELLSYTEVRNSMFYNAAIPTTSDLLQKYVRHIHKKKTNDFANKDAHHIHYLKNIYRKLDREQNNY